MTSHIEKGKYGEKAAKAYLSKKGFDILFSNWRLGRYEIDIIAIRNKIVHFIEVKTRHSLKFGYPEEAVTKKKFDCLRKAASGFQHRYPAIKNIQFDILSILLLPGKQTEYFFIEDVYLY